MILRGNGVGLGEIGKAKKQWTLWKHRTQHSCIKKIKKLNKKKNRQISKELRQGNTL